MPNAQFIQIFQPNAAAVAQELLQGLCAPQAMTSPKYLYDALGSRLFEAITELPEYDVTRTEARAMQLHGSDARQVNARQRQHAGASRPRHVAPNRLHRLRRSGVFGVRRQRTRCNTRLGADPLCSGRSQIQNALGHSRHASQLRSLV
mgnify:CR=1 FL=1